MCSSDFRTSHFSRGRKTVNCTPFACPTTLEPEGVESSADTMTQHQYHDSIKLIEMPEHDSISVCVYNEHDGLFALGERINAKHEEAYMNGYNWDALIRFYVAQRDPNLMEEVETDPEAGMFSAYMSYSPENLEKMTRFESHIRAMVSNDEELIAFVDANVGEIEWD